jgi:hypothetical protein
VSARNENLIKPKSDSTGFSLQITFRFYMLMLFNFRRCESLRLIKYCLDIFLKEFKLKYFETEKLAKSYIK